MTNTQHTAKHTPGPWEVTGPHSREVITTNPGTYKPCMTIAKVGGYWDGEAQANAALIAAAPAMYEALKQAYAYLAEMGCNCDEGQSCGDCIVCQCEAAIAQAEGKI